MIISAGRKYIFVHIPKTGGTSLSRALEDRAMKDDILIGDTPKALRRKNRLKDLQPAGRLWKHAKLSDIDGIANPADFFVVTLVRNPWDRMVSYYHWLRDQSFAHPAVALAQRLPFSGFLNHPVVEKALKANAYGSYVTDHAGQERCQLFARLENLSDDLEPFWTHLGFRCVLERYNTSSRSPQWQTYYSSADAAHVAEICAEDIARFGYTFDGAPANT